MTLTAEDLKTWNISRVHAATTDHAIDAATRALAVHELNTRHLRMYGEFIDDPERLPPFLDDNGVIVSGSFPLRYIEGENGPQPNDLDLFTGANHFHATLIFFVARGYVITNPSDLVTDKGYPGAFTVAKLARGDKLVDVIKTATSAPTLTPTEFWSTAQMNYLTGTHLCVMYPALTMQRIGLLAPSGLDSEGQPKARTSSLIAKYEARGYQFYTNKDGTPADWFPPNGLYHADSIAPTTIRRQEDDHCLVIRWAAATPESSPTMKARNREVQWGLGGWVNQRLQSGWARLIESAVVESWAFGPAAEGDLQEVEADA